MRPLALPRVGRDVSLVGSVSRSKRRRISALGHSRRACAQAREYLCIRGRRSHHRSPAGALTCNRPMSPLGPTSLEAAFSTVALHDLASGDRGSHQEARTRGPEVRVPNVRVRRWRRDRGVARRGSKATELRTKQRASLLPDGRIPSVADQNSMSDSTSTECLDSNFLTGPMRSPAKYLSRVTFLADFCVGSRKSISSLNKLHS